MKNVLQTNGNFGAGGHLSPTPPPMREGHGRGVAFILGLSALTGCLLWAYWPTWSIMSERWAHDPVYSHGYLVPAFALVLLWFRRRQLASLTIQPSWIGGLVLLLAGVFIRLAGAYYYLSWLDAISLIPCLAGLCLFVAGWQALKWSWPAIAFLFFMTPLPFQVEVALRLPLQNLATRVSTYALQTLGCPAFAEGNIIVLGGGIHLGVAEACSGLSMLLIFFALSTAVALLIHRPLWEKCLIVLSAVPIAVIANVARITATGLLYHLDYGQAARVVFHDLAGWLMMPLGLGLLWIELRILGQLLVIPERSRIMAVPLVSPGLVGRHESKKKGRKRKHSRSKG